MNAAAQQATRLLGGAWLEPASVPDSAVLLVRRLADPMPRGLSRDAAAATASAAWERAARTSIAACYRTAARPARGDSAASANAVCFDDRADLLACLLRDALAGVATERWWWRAYLHATKRSLDAALAAVWREETNVLPAMLDRLANTGHAIPVVCALTRAEAARVIAEVARAHAAPALWSPAPLTCTAPIAARARVGTAGAAARAVTIYMEGARADETSGAPPWVAIAPEVPPVPAMPLESTALLGIALTLARAPRVARSRAFARAVHAWRELASVARDPEHDGAAPARLHVQSSVDAGRPRASSGLRVPGETPGPNAVESDVRAPTGSPRVDGASGDRAEVESAEPILARARIAPPGASPASAVRDVSGAAPDEPIALRAVHDPAASGQARARLTAEDAQVTQQVTADEHGVHAAAAPVRDDVEGAPGLSSPPRPEPVTVFTELAGAFYLVNAFTALGIWDEVDETFDAPLPIGGWGWIAHVAHALLATPGCGTDPVWRALAMLDGRDDEPVLPMLAGDARAFGQRVVDTVRTRIVDATGIDAASLADRVLQVPGWLYVTSSHVDVRMPLDRVDVDLRFAGLDADPGWVPVLGRVVTFHFDAGDA
jgi:hypothetical protein